MLKKILLTSVLSLGVMQAYAQLTPQYTFNALQLSSQYYDGTARSLAMGNAMTALGGDLGALSYNPAASGVYRYTEFTLTPSVYSASASTTFLGNTSKDSRTRFALSNVGWVGAFETGRTRGLLNFNLAITANQTNNFAFSSSGSGTQNGSSYLGSLAASVPQGVFGYDMDVTNAVANDLKERMRALPGVRDVKLSRDDLRPEYNVVFDRERLAYYGMNSATASQAVRNRIDGLVASKYREDGDEYDIVVRYAEPFRTRVEDVENITLYNAQGRPVKLKEVGRVEEEYAAPMIERENRQRVISVESTLGAGVALGDVVAELNRLIAGYPTPDGVDLEVGGTVEDQGDAFSDLLTLFVLIVILVYIVMATQFESLKFPFIIMFTIPFAFTGVFLALWLTSTPLSLIALIGAIMLVGIVTKNGIVMVDYMNLLIERGSGVYEAVIAGGKSRLRPVLMTSFTTVLGMLPLAIGTGAGSETWQPMGIAVIGGLTFSTILTLFIVPVLYSILVHRSRRREQRRLARQATMHQAGSH